MKLVVECPLGKLDLGDQYGFNPMAAFHDRRRNPKTPSACGFRCKVKRPTAQLVRSLPLRQPDRNRKLTYFCYFQSALVIHRPPMLFRAGSFLFWRSSSFAPVLRRRIVCSSGLIGRVSGGSLKCSDKLTLETQLQGSQSGGDGNQ
jgi:hypothetical protein